MNSRKAVGVGAVIALMILVSQSGFADLKVKTRMTVMGHTTESTVYIKGARERREMSFGGRGGMATITQCDQKRMISIMGDRCTITNMGGSGNETTCPAMPAMGGMEPEEPTAPPKKGGVITITRTSTDTGERQEMFGYKARHLKSSMAVESSPDACNPSHMKMETDGWYADLSTAFSCGDEGVRQLACGGMGRPSQPSCRDRVVMKGTGGGAAPGFPLKQTMTMTSEHGTFTSSTEVVELTSATLDAPLFDAPPGCRNVDMASLMGATPAGEPAPAVAKETPPPAAQPATPTVAPPPAPSVPPKTAGVVRVGVVKLKDMSGQYLPTENLRINLMSEIGLRHMEAVPLETEAPEKDVEAEARAKQCDYILYTVPTQVKPPGTGGLPTASVPKGTTLDPAKFQALTAMTLYKIGKPQPEIKEAHFVADGEQLGVNAVMATFEKESDKLAQQVQEDAKPRAASKVPARKPATKKPK